MEEEDGLDQLSQLTPKVGKSQKYQCRDFAPLGPKSRRLQYGKGQREEEDYRGNEINLAVEEIGGSEPNIYHHIIYEYKQRLIVLG